MQTRRVWHTRGTRRPKCNAIQNNKSEVKKFVIKYGLYHYETPSYFFVDFLHFLRFLECAQSMQVLEKIVQFSNNHFPQNEHFIQSHFSFVTQ
jgi:hypothetical protein